MRRVLLFGVAAVFACSTAGLAQSRTVEKTVKLSPGGSLSLTATKGSVKLTAWDRPEVQITARIEAGQSFEGDDDYARRAVEAADVEISGEGSAVRIRSDYERVPYQRDSWNNNRTIPEIHYDIRAPKRADLTLDLDRSNSAISGFDGRLRIESDRSELRVTDVAGDLTVDIDRGGRSIFRNVTGSFALDGDRTDVEVGLAKLTDRGHLELDRGEARIHVDEQQPLTIRTDIERRGSFESELPMQLSGGGSPESPEGTINGGGPTLTVVAHRAHVKLQKR